MTSLLASSAAPRLSLRTGDVIAGRYRVLDALGSGGMGVVVAATDDQTGERVAVKVLLPELAAQPELALRFEREAKAAGRLRSEHATRIFDAGFCPDREIHYLVMELLEGHDLQKILRERSHVPVAEAASYVIEACDALGEAHALGVVHRDLKPGNLFLARSPSGGSTLKVLDFGISKSFATADDGPTLTTTGSVLGSPHYMAPEQARNPKSVDARADIWSLGVILYRLTTGALPFEATTLIEYLWRVSSEAPRPLRERLPTAPAAFEGLVSRGPWTRRGAIAMP